MTVDPGAARREIEAAIPHRAPFLLVDRIVDRAEEALDAEWRVPPDAEWFRGHYPGEPVTPGVLISEHVFQTAALFVSERLGGFAPEDGIPVLAKIEGARFKRVVRPGEILSTRVRLTERLGPAWYFAGTTTSGGETVLKVRFVLSATRAMARAVEAPDGGGA